jgi:hypothetical protein
MLERGSRRADRAEQVHVEDPPPFVVVVGVDGTDGANACIVDQDVEATQLPGSAGHSFAHGRVVGDVGSQRE